MNRKWILSNLRQAKRAEARGGARGGSLTKGPSK